MKVCIAEKPSVARDIARIIGATKSKQGYIEGNGYQVTWTFGHLCELKEPREYQPNWKHWSLAALPMIPNRFGIKLIENEGIAKQFAIIEKLFKNADEIINCGDAGQEGELIQRWVMLKAKVTCPVKRLWISSMTDEAIKQGFATLKPQDCYKNLYMAGLSRAIGDWLLGLNATRLYTLKYAGNNFRHDGKILSIGRVQTPTLALIVKRDKEIAEFKPEPYWVLATIYRETQFTATKGKFATKEEGEQAFSLIEEKDFIVKDQNKKKGTEQPKPLYDLTSLQVDCNKKFGLTAETTLNTIQGLYERKLTTYPRVDTQYLTDDIYKQCPKIMNSLYKIKFSGQQPYSLIVKALSGVPLPKTKNVFDNSKVTDHHAIIPTNVVPKELTDIERKVYDLIARRFIAAFYPSCKFSTTTVLGKVDKIEFKTVGKEIIDEGWHKVYAESIEENQHNASKEQEKILPKFEVGERGQHKPTLTEKQTTAPKHFTEASLLRAMETAGKLTTDETLRAALKENGIGRPSSRASIIETLFKRNYIKRKKKNILSTDTGQTLINIIKDPLLTSVELTGIWEKKLRDIAQDKYNPKKFIEELKTQINEIVIDVLSDNTNKKIISNEN